MNIYKIISCMLVISGLLCAQTLSTTGPTKVRVGQTLNLTVNFTAGAAQVSGFQFDLPAQSWSTMLPNKSITCNTANGRCVFIGDNNADPLATGGVVSIAWVVPSIIPTSISLTNVVATTPVGLAAPITITTPVALSLIGDVNGDRQLTSADVAAAKDQMTGKAPCTTGDQNEDGVCNVRDVQLVINEVRAAGA